MTTTIPALALGALAAIACASAAAQDDRGYKVYQFPANKIPVIDGKADDWRDFPDAYVVGTDQLRDDSGKGRKLDPKSLDVKVRVAWVAGLNRLYFLYEAWDDHWDFADPGLHNDTFEIVVDGDLSGGPLVDTLHPNQSLPWGQRYFGYHGVHAQNYHIFTPADGKDWTLLWGPQAWLKKLPHSNIAYAYDFRPGQPGRLTAEFWITPFDYAGADPARAVETQLTENGKIGLTWAVIDYDGADEASRKAFWNLSEHRKMYGNSSLGTVFTLMPLDAKHRKAFEAQWSFVVTDMARRSVTFRDESVGPVTRWHWDFGDGATSGEQHPVHRYEQAGKYLVVLTVEGPQGTSRRAKLWDVAVE